MEQNTFSSVMGLQLNRHVTLWFQTGIGNRLLKADYLKTLMANGSHTTNKLRNVIGCQAIPCKHNKTLNFVLNRQLVKRDIITWQTLSLFLVPVRSLAEAFALPERVTEKTGKYHPVQMNGFVQYLATSCPISYRTILSENNKQQLSAWNILFLFFTQQENHVQ